MRIAILSDIHANLEALVAVKVDLDQQGVEKVVCLGDMVGYGPDPELVLSFTRENNYCCILGNHEAALFRKKDRQWMNFQARDNNLSTREILSETNYQYCRALPRFVEIENALFVHGFPPDSVLTYLHTCPDERVAEELEQMKHRVVFLGHTHRLYLVCMDNGELKREKIREGRISLKDKSSSFVNCGSVGQPRDGTSHAKYVVWDSNEDSIDVRFVVYDSETTIRKINARGFPSVYGMRLR